MTATIGAGSIEVAIEMRLGALAGYVRAWEDVSCMIDRAAGVTFAAGASDDAGPTTVWQAATCAFRLVGDAFDPFGSGAYSAAAGPAVDTRVRWRSLDPTTAAAITAMLGADEGSGWRTAFYGRVTPDGWPYIGNHEKPALSTVDIVAADLTAWWAAKDQLFIPAPVDEFGLVTAGSRIWDLVTSSGAPSGFNSVTYIQLAGTLVDPQLAGTPLWDAFNETAAADLGLVWINRRGNVAYRSAARVEYRAAMADLVVCAAPPAIHLVDLGPNAPTVLRNVVTINHELAYPTAPNDGNFYRSDFASVSRYGDYKYADLSMKYAATIQGWRIAYAMLTGAAPNPAPSTVALDTRVDAKSIALLLGAELDHQYRTQGPAGGPFFQVGPIGWNVVLDHKGVRGSIVLSALDRYHGAIWDDPAAKWDDASTTWGV